MITYRYEDISCKPYRFFIFEDVAKSDFLVYIYIRIRT